MCNKLTTTCDPSACYGIRLIAESPATAAARDAYHEARGAEAGASRMLTALNKAGRIDMAVALDLMRQLQAEAWDAQAGTFPTPVEPSYAQL